MLQAIRNCFVKEEVNTGLSSLQNRRGRKMSDLYNGCTES